MSKRNELNNQHIWQQNDLDPTTTTVMYIDRKHIANLHALVEQIRQIEAATECIIKLHDIQSEIIWIRVKSSSQETAGERGREAACKLVDAATNFQCKEVKLPSIADTTLASIEESNKRVATTTTSDVVKKRPLTRSSTENQLSSISGHNGSGTSPFGSFLAPLSLNAPANQSIREDEDDYEDVCMTTTTTASNKSPSQSGNKAGNGESAPKNSKLRIIYTADFLLKRADMANSKKLPPNWPELSQKYPSVCFCGKVISYFNPAKYYDHWAKTQAQNPELHDSMWPVISSSQSNQSISTLSRTDDYLVFKYGNNGTSKAPNGVNFPTTSLTSGGKEANENRNPSRHFAVDTPPRYFKTFDLINNPTANGLASGANMFAKIPARRPQPTFGQTTYKFANLDLEEPFARQLKLKSQNFAGHPRFYMPTNSASSMVEPGTRKSQYNPFASVNGQNSGYY